MRRLLFLTAAVLFTVMNVWSAPADEASARQRALQFMSSRGDVLRYVPSSDVTLLYTGMSNVLIGQATYYIYSTGDSFIIVAGDDRVQGVLAYGDAPIDMDNIPCGLQSLLDLYTGEVDFLFEHPTLTQEDLYPVLIAATPGASGDVEPLMTEMWYQLEPYNNLCPEYLGERCVTGCACTSLSMVFHHWRYSNLTTTVPAYTTYELGLSLEALPATTFDWDNMLDRYVPGSYTDEEAEAVAKLMRYVGQSEYMDYTPDGSGASANSILNTVKKFGYSTTATLLTKGRYSESQWRDLIRAELLAGRPIVYVGYDKYNGGGHAFNVDGYDAENGLFHINFGWDGYGNAYCALNDFSAGTVTYSSNQSMIIGIQPPESTQPEITVSPSTLTLNTQTGKTVSKTILVIGKNLTGDLAIQLNDATGAFSINKTTMSANEAVNGANLTVTYSPTEAGLNSASVTISGGGAEPRTIALNGIAIAQAVTVTPDELSFNTEVGETATATFTVTADNLPEALTLTLNDVDGVYAIDKTSITANEAAAGATVTVTYSPTVAAVNTATVTVSGIGAETKTVSLSGTAVSSDPVGPPVITTSVDELDFGFCYNGYREYRSLELVGENLTEEITLSLSGPRSIDFTISGPTVITPEMAQQGVTVTVVSFPYSEGIYRNLYLVISYPELDDIKVPITGQGIKTGAYLYPDQTSMAFETTVGHPVTLQLGVTKTEFDGWIASPRIDLDSLPDVGINPPVISSIVGDIEGDDCFSIKSSRRTTSSDGKDSVIFTIEYYPLEEGPHSAQLTLSTLSRNHQAHPVTVELTGEATLLDFLPGDMNGDNELTLSDVDLLIQQLTNKDPDVEENPVADVNGDERVNLQDIIDLIDVLLRSSLTR